MLTRPEVTPAILSAPDSEPVVPSVVTPESSTVSAPMPLSWMTKSPVDERLWISLPVPLLVKVKLSAPAPKPIEVDASSVIEFEIEFQSIVLASISEFEIDVPSVAATVTVSVAPPVVVMPVPAAIVSVSPFEIVWFEPDVPATVKAVPAAHDDHAGTPELV